MTCYTELSTPELYIMENNNYDYETLWADSDFSRNPYDYRPLRTNSDDRALFVGRNSQQGFFKMQVAGPEGGIVIVEGPVGVGKTSFVNAMLYDKWNPENKGSKNGKKSHHYLPSFETIQLQENVELSDFMLSVLSNCIFSLEKIRGENVSKSSDILKAGKELIANTVRSEVSAFNISVLGSGGGINKNDIPIQPMRIPLPTIMNTMDRWFNEVTVKFGYEAVLVPINNLDIMPERAIINFLNSARDTLLSRTHVWWILVGGPGLFSSLETNARRVSELITGQSIGLESLSLKEVQEAIKLRIKRFRTSHNARPPISEETIEMLYEVSGGEVRYIFKRLTDIIYRFRSAFPSERCIPTQIALKSLRSLAQEKLDTSNLTRREREVLELMSKAGNFRVRDYSKFGYTQPQPMQNIISKFLMKNLLRRMERSAKEVYYSTSGDVNLIFRNSF